MFFEHNFIHLLRKSGINNGNLGLAVYTFSDVPTPGPKAEDMVSS